MDSRRRPTPKPNPKLKAAGSTSRMASSSSRSAGSASKSASSISKAIGSTSDLSKDVQMNEEEVEHEVEVKYTGLPTPCKNCGIIFGSFFDYYSHLVYSPIHTHQLPMQPPVDLELKLYNNSQPNVDLELRLSPPTNQKK